MLCESLTAVHMLVILTPNTSVVRTRRCSIRSRDEILYWLDVTLTRYCHVSPEISRSRATVPSANPYSGPSVEVDTVRPVSVESDRAAVPVPFGTVAPRRSSFRSPGRGQDPSLYCAMPAPACREPSMCSTLPPAPQWRGGGAEISAEITPRDIARHTTTHCNTLDNTRTKRKHEMPVRCLIPRQGGAPACKPCGAPSP